MSILKNYVAVALRNITRHKGYSFISIFGLSACLGLSGPASFTAERRKKEIGIRTVLGASVDRILLLRSMEFILLPSITFVIASIAIYVLIQRYLEGVAYHIVIFSSSPSASRVTVIPG